MMALVLHERRVEVPMRHLGKAVFLLISSQLLACGREREPALTPAAAVVQDKEQAAQSIATERCRRAQDCNDIGPQADYMSWQHCMNTSLTEARDKLAECRYGIKSDDLSECLTDVQDQDCGSALGAVRTSLECRASELCLD
jgi:hypothetical protein